MSDKNFLDFFSPCVNDQNNAANFDMLDLSGFRNFPLGGATEPKNSVKGRSYLEKL